MTEEKTSELVVLIEKSPLELTTKEQLKEQFSDYAAQVAVWKSGAANLKVTDVSQKDLMKECKTARLAVKSIRVEIEKTRKRLKADSLERGKAIDNIAKYLAEQIEPLEEFLQEQEDFEKNLIAARIAELKAIRIAKLQQIEGVDASFYNVEAMSEQVFSELLDKLNQEAADRIEKAKQQKILDEAEAIRKQKEWDDQIAENKRLKEEKAKAELEAANARAEARNAAIKLETEQKKAATFKQTIVQQKEELKEVKAATQEVVNAAAEVHKAAEAIAGQFVTETDPRILLTEFLKSYCLNGELSAKELAMIPSWRAWVKTKFRKL